MYDLEIEIVTENDIDDSYQNNDVFVAVESPVAAEERVATDEVDNDDPTRDDEPQDNASTPSSEPFESTSLLICARTGLVFPSSNAMRLLGIYDDGISPPVTSAPLPMEPVFCRICREGLHDDADEQQPSSAMETEGDEVTRREQSKILRVKSDKIGSDGIDTDEGGDLLH